jgi:hypothetical protein
MILEIIFGPKKDELRLEKLCIKRSFIIVFHVK